MKMYVLSLNEFTLFSGISGEEIYIIILYLHVNLKLLKKLLI